MNAGWLGYTGDYTTQFYGDYHKPVEGSHLNNQHKRLFSQIKCCQGKFGGKFFAQKNGALIGVMTT